MRHLVFAAPASVVLALVSGCTRNVDDARPMPAAVAAPIQVLQVVDLLSPKVLGTEGNLFVTVEPERCSGLAQEVDPPFLDANRPLATDGGHWITEDGVVFVEEMVAVYRFDFDPAAALDDVRRAVDSCRDTPLTVTTMGQRKHVFEVLPATSDTPQGSVAWRLRSADWNCDNTFVAAHNAAIEITTCGAAGGLDVAKLADDALKRIDALANTTA
ncbi:MAG: sensor domain-containing protein [Actinomycetia bacterium]|nr:sensor domain-containing protein [Actinomycetes bacterium]MCH9766194.1 sensor domain-containing protein [Actinomycetes bacterium]